jgi:hypothetical protein
MMMSEKDNVSNSTVMRLRAHHICCLPFWTGAMEGRGSRFEEKEAAIKALFRSAADREVAVIEGVDELCSECPLCVDGRCASPDGDEDAVRKWDAILLSGLGIDFNTRLTCRQWRDLIEPKLPYKLCRRCRWQSRCRVGSGLQSVD